MSDIAKIEARLQSALERIAKGVELLPAAKSAVEANAKAGLNAEAELAKVRSELEAEKAEHTKLAERVTAIRERQEQMSEQLEKRVVRLQERVSEQESELGRLKRVNAALRDNARALRRAVAEGVPDAELLNSAMEAELEATRAAQSADRGELNAILAELTPLIEEKADV